MLIQLAVLELMHMRCVASGQTLLEACRQPVHAGHSVAHAQGLCLFEGSKPTALIATYERH